MPFYKDASSTSSLQRASPRKGLQGYVPSMSFEVIESKKHPNFNREG